MGKRDRGRSQPKPSIVDHVSDSDDEEIPEDEAFNSEDEQRYGAFFDKGEKTSDGKSDSGEELSSDEEEEDADSGNDSDEEEDGDGGQYMLDLLNKLDSNKEEKVQPNNVSHLKDSEFAASVLSKQGLTLTDLMSGLEDTKGYGVMQKQFREVAKGQTTRVPVAKVVSNRSQRKIAYSDNKTDISQWIETVQQNRQAESLDFRPKERVGLTKNKLVDKFKPTTLFEKELQTALFEAGQQDEQAMLKKEEALLKQDDLGSTELTLEEFNNRRGQLAKMRALMFYHEQKRHHINKIKSKKYRRIRKKQRERAKDSEVEAQLQDDPDLAKELEEKEEMERMKERMTLAHKNTSKWAKRMLKRGKNADTDVRRALSAQLKRGDDLRKKQHGDSPDTSDDEDENLAESARKVLADVEGNGENIKSKGLFQLSFMQKGIAKQREKAKEEAMQLLRELEDSEEENGSVSETALAEETTKQQKKKKKKALSQEQLKSVLEEGKLVANSLEFGNSDTIAVSGGIDINVDLDPITRRDKEEKRQNSAASEHTSTLKVGPIDDEERPKKVDQTDKVNTDSSDSHNPWLQEEEASSQKETKKKQKSAVNNNGVIDIDGAVTSLTTKVGDDKEIEENETKENSSSSEKPITSLTQEELVKRAFSTAPEEDIDEEFAKEKAAMEERDDPTRKVKDNKPKISSGWGSWAGLGSPMPNAPKKFPKKLQPPEQKIVNRKRKDEQKPHLIISEKRQKKTANKFQIANIPYPYKSREEYERAMAGGIGSEWNVTSATKSMIRPDIMTRTGKIIQPISKRAKKKMQRGPAKF